ncbi:MAG TPA: hypothetical protein VHV09_16455 [Trebonia sp.]|jgi:hypothetical protein|nr:hypothetical protein [Trebonia sp.]
MTGDGPAVSRLCVATAAGARGPLSSIQEGRGFYRLHLMTDPADGAEFAVASPGLDEVSLIGDLITALHEAAALAGCAKTAAWPRQPVVVGFHLGITRVTDDGFRGRGVDRALALVRDPAIAVRASARVALAGTAKAEPLLAAAITAAFFEDLCAAGMSAAGWQRVAPASAWLRLFDGPPPRRRPALVG